MFGVKRDKVSTTTLTDFADKDQKAPNISENMLNILLNQLDIKDKQLEEKEKGRRDAPFQSHQAK